MAQKSFQLQLESYIINPEKGVNVLHSLQAPEDSGVSYPHEGLNVLYGKRYAAETLAEVARKTRAEGRLLIPVVMNFFASRPSDSKHWFDTWEGKTVFDMRRIKDGVEFEGKIAQLWRKYLREDGFSDEDIGDMGCWSRLQYIERFPQYIDRLHKESEFKDIEIFIWATREGGKQVTRATIYSTKNLIGARAVTAEPISVELPRGIKNAA